MTTRLRETSRPHVSDDNAFSEAQFKTLKYQPDYPGRFAGELYARGWLEPFFGWHNDEHHPTRTSPGRRSSHLVAF